MLRIDVEELEDVLILDCIGKITRGEETPLLCAALQGYGRKIILDLSKVDSIDAAAVGALIALQASGIYLKLLNASQAVREFLRTRHLESIFEMADSHIEVCPAY
jgi:anti-anti-sigma factor